jgi:hypothetical protein
MDKKRERLWASIETKKAEVLRRMEALSPEDYVTGDWSPAQIGDHLTLAEQRMRVAPTGERVAFSPKVTVICTFLRLAPAISSKAPIEPQNVALSELRARWDASRKELRAALETASAGTVFGQHPIAGPLDVMGYLSITDAHLTYHLKRWPG